MFPSSSTTERKHDDFNLLKEITTPSEPKKTHTIAQCQHDRNSYHTSMRDKILSVKKFANFTLQENNQRQIIIKDKPKSDTNEINEQYFDDRPRSYSPD